MPTAKQAAAASRVLFSAYRQLPSPSFSTECHFSSCALFRTSPETSMGSPDGSLKTAYSILSPLRARPRLYIFPLPEFTSYEASALIRLSWLGGMCRWCALGQGQTLLVLVCDDR